MDVNSVYLEKYLVMIGEAAIDIALYITKMCSFNHKVFFLDLTCTGMILNIVSPDGHTESCNIHYSNSMGTGMTHQYDFIIAFSNDVKDIPRELLSGNVFVFTRAKKSNIIGLARDVKLLSDIEGLHIIYRGVADEDMFYKRLYLSSIVHGIENKILFIRDSQKDVQVFRHMEYNMVFLYDELSDDLKKFLSSLYREIINSNAESMRFKWVM